ncbi:ankyrin repeat-containing domain protein [Paraphoma chrysanthemicola]|uniref:Ankyrin repeat-containing domain protein n=1 Tax=Paraphoma chrysanthemicola TaxID=798071 RepID=A0A8K0W3H8_9PLEO|nr:ankyrin repeat-containing domain protein [Paraphoma chrysanthemicola]
MAWDELWFRRKAALANSAKAQPFYDELCNLGTVTTASKLHRTPTKEFEAPSEDLPLPSTAPLSGEKLGDEPKHLPDADGNIGSASSAKLLDSNYNANRSIYGPETIFESPPTKSNTDFVNQTASSEIDSPDLTSILELSSSAAIELLLLTPKEKPSIQRELDLLETETLDGCGCIEDIAQQPEHMLIKLLQDSIVDSACETGLDGEIFVLPDNFTELFNSSTSLNLVALRLALSIECLGFIQWYQSTFHFWPAGVREDVMVSMCDKPNRELFQCIADDWLGSGDVKIRVMERLAYNGDLELMDYMIERYETHGENWYLFSIHVNALDLALIAACAKGHVAIVRRLIELGANVKGPSLGKSMLAELFHTPSRTFYETPLVAAAGLRPENHGEILDILLYSGARDGGQRAMRKALEERSPEMIWCLIEHGISPNVILKQREWALTIGVATSHNKLVSAMLDTGIDINRVTSIWACRTVLQYSAAKGDDANVETFLDRGAHINNRGHASDWGGNCALIAAASCGHANTVRLLLNRGAKVEGACSIFGDLLQTICYLGYASVLEVLLDVQPPGLDWSVRTIHGEDLPALAARAFITPQKKMFERADNEKVIRLLTTKVSLFRTMCAVRVALIAAEARTPSRLNSSRTV